MGAGECEEVVVMVRTLAEAEGMCWEVFEPRREQLGFSGSGRMMLLFERRHRKVRLCLHF